MSFIGWIEGQDIFEAGERVASFQITQQAREKN